MPRKKIRLHSMISLSLPFGPSRQTPQGFGSFAVCQMPTNRTWSPATMTVRASCALGHVRCSLSCPVRLSVSGRNRSKKWGVALSIGCIAAAWPFPSFACPESSARVERARSVTHVTTSWIATKGRPERYYRVDSPDKRLLAGSCEHCQAASLRRPPDPRRAHPECYRCALCLDHSRCCIHKQRSTIPQ